MVKIRVLLVDDALARACLRMILSSPEELEVVAEAADGGDAVAAAGPSTRCRPEGNPDARDGRDRRQVGPARTRDVARDSPDDVPGRRVCDERDSGRRRRVPC